MRLESSRTLSCLAIFMAVAGTLTACQYTSPETRHSKFDFSASSGAEWVEETLIHMTARELISQMIIVMIPDDYDAFNAESFGQLRESIIDFGAGGIVLLRGEPLSQSTTISDLQAESRIPLLVAQDMEWGAAMRVSHATEFPKAMGIGATQDPEFAREAGRITALEARSLGVNFILAPVADINSNSRNPVIGVRSFGDDPESVSLFVTAFVEGVQQEKIIASVKHFPGHGSTDADSHVSLPRLDPERIQTLLLDLRPFKSAIESGVGAVMTGHLAVARADDELVTPATLSDSLLQDVLRHQLGFDGLIISDAMNMAGVGRSDNSNSIAVRAVQAGVDLLLAPGDPHAIRNAILSAITNGEISENQIRESVRRILSAKESIGLTTSPAPLVHAVRSTLTRPAHKAFASELARRSLVLLNEDGVLDRLRNSRLVKVLPITDSTSGDRLQHLRNSVQRYTTEVDFLEPVLRQISGEVSLPDIDLSEPIDFFVIADLTFDRSPDPVFLKSVVSEISRKVSYPGNTSIVVLALGSPYSAGLFEATEQMLLISFGASSMVIDAVVDVLFGRAAICGHLPIQLSDYYPRGSGICVRQALPRKGLPEESGLSGKKLRSLTGLILQAIADSAFPGAAIAVGRAGVLAELRGYGNFTYDSSRSVTTSSVFDLASLTKVIATTTAVMQLYEADKIRLDDPISRFIPAFAKSEKDAVTVRHLLTHSGGLIPFRPYYLNSRITRNTVIDEILNDSLIFEPGSQSRYTDLGPIVLALLVEKITGISFDEYTRKNIFEPLGMSDTGFRSVSRPGNSDNVVPTEVDDYFRNRLIQGIVHDETAYVLGGTAGHAGLFSTVEDLSRFAFMMASEGQLGELTFLKAETIRLFTGAADPEGLYTRALGWDTRSKNGYSSAGRHFGRLSYGHTGFTGTSIWIDPDQKMFVILLTNRVYPTRENRKYRLIRPAVVNLAFEAIQNPPSYSPYTTHFSAATASR